MKRILTSYFALFFVAVIALPTVSDYLNIKPDIAANVPKNEVVYAPPPKTADDLSDFFQYLSEYARAEFAFRDILASWDIWLRVNMLDSFMMKVQASQSSKPKEIRCDFRIENSARMTRLIRPYRAFYKELSNRSIPYIVINAPSKVQIRQAALCQAGTFHKSDVADAILTYEPEIILVDMADTFFNRAPHEPLMYENDNHWTDRGAFLGYQALYQSLSTLFDVGPALSADDFTIDSFLAHRALMKNYNPKKHSSEPESVELMLLNKETTASRIDPEAAETLGVWEYNSKTEHYVNARKDLPRALVYHGSMFKQLKPWMAEHFSEVQYIWSQHMDFDLIDSYDPDIVIQQIVQ